MNGLDWDRVNAAVEATKKALSFETSKSFDELKKETKLSDSDLCLALGYHMGSRVMGLPEGKFLLVNLYK